MHRGFCISPPSQQDTFVRLDGVRQVGLAQHRQHFPLNGADQRIDGQVVRLDPERVFQLIAQRIQPKEGIAATAFTQSPSHEFYPYKS